MKIRLERVDDDSVEQREASVFPFKIGRAKDCDYRIEAKGVWPRHLILEDDGENGIIINCDSEASLLINSESVSKSVRLQNGDLIQFGSVNLRFWLAPIVQIEQRNTEMKIWLGLSLLIFVQLGLIFWLIKFL
ncbi:MAG: FHA domain-containing protein [Verrucomicrobiota bacterium]|nr:FHA domain-containing protein [Verrucomicrobiota bacterium]